MNVKDNPDGFLSHFLSFRILDRMDCLTPCRNRIPRPRVFCPAPKPPPAAGTFSPGLRQKNGRFLPPLLSSGRTPFAWFLFFVRAHIMRPQNGTNHDQNHRGSSLAVGAHCAPLRSGTLPFRRGAYHAPTERDRERSKPPEPLSRCGRTLCAPTDLSAIGASAVPPVP